MSRYVIEYENSSHPGWNQSGNGHSNDSGVSLLGFDFPNLEAAQREAIEQHRRHPSLIYRARDTQEGASMSPGVVLTEPIAQPRAVRIYRRNRQWVIETSGREIPLIAQLTPYLPAGLKGLRHERYAVVDALVAGVSPQVLTSALSAWYTEHPNNMNGGEPVIAEGVSELPDNNAYLAMGDYIYKMVPVRQAGSSKAIRLMRERVRVEIDRVREGLRQQASQEAQQMIAQANQTAARIRDEAQRLLDDANSAPKFPAWTKGYTVRMDGNNRIFMLKKLSIVIKELAHGSLRWKAKEAPAVTAYLWLPLDGCAERVTMFDNSLGYLPHITTSGACMKIGETVQPITSLATLDRFANQVVRVHSTINLASLLTPEVSFWLPQAQAVLPDSVKTWLGRYTRLGDQRDCPIEHLPAGHETEEGVATWSVR